MTQGTAPGIFPSRQPYGHSGLVRFAGKDFCGRAKLRAVSALFVTRGHEAAQPLPRRRTLQDLPNGPTEFATNRAGLGLLGPGSLPMLESFRRRFLRAGHCGIVDPAGSSWTQLDRCGRRRGWRAVVRPPCTSVRPRMHIEENAGGSAGRLPISRSAAGPRKWGKKAAPARP